MEEKKLEDYKDLGDIDSLQEKGRTKFKKAVKDYGKITFIIYFVVLIIVVLFIIFISNYRNILENSGIIKFISDYSGLFFIFSVLFICFGLSLYMRLFYVKRRGKNYFKLYVNNLREDSLKNILSDLYYKEIEYKGEKVYYAYKNMYSINVSSLKRYMKFSFKDNYLLIESWSKIYGVEIPIMFDDNLPGGISYINSVMINDLKYIRDCIQKNENL